MRDFPIDITVTKQDEEWTRFGRDTFEIRGETSCNGERLQSVLMVDDHMRVFEYNRRTKKVFVRDTEHFDHLIREVKHRLMRYIGDAYQPRIALGG